VRVIFFFLSFFLLPFFFEMCGFLARAHAQGRDVQSVNMIVDRRDASTIERER